MIRIQVTDLLPSGVMLCSQGGKIQVIFLGEGVDAEIALLDMVETKNYKGEFNE